MGIFDKEVVTSTVYVTFLLRLVNFGFQILLLKVTHNSILLKRDRLSVCECLLFWFLESLTLVYSVNKNKSSSQFTTTQFFETSG